MSEFGFKFEIGSFVRFVAQANQTLTDKVYRWGSDSRELRGQIVDRTLQECPGGVQRHYTVKWHDHLGGFVKELQQHNEIELVASEPFPPNKSDD